jgi:tetratricopeptide (TPR) repeat protein
MLELVSGLRWLHAARWAVVLTIVGAVLVFHPRAADAFGLPKTLVLVVGTVVATACVVLWKVESGDPFPKLRALPWLGGLVASAGLATATSQVRLLSLLGAYTRYCGLLTFVTLGVLTAVSAIAFAFDARGRRWALFAIVGAAIAVTVYAVLQRFGIDAFDFRDATGLKPDFPGSTVGNSLFAGSVCGMALPVAVALAVRASARARLAWFAAALALGAGLWATSSRSGILGAMAGVAVVALVTPGRWRRVLVRASAAGALVALLLAVVVVWHPGAEHAPGPLAHRQVLRTESLTIRGGEWSAAWHVWLSRPLVGTGPDTFANSSPRHRSRDDAKRFGLRIADKPHNLYLEYLASTGIIGLVAFLAFVVAVVRRAADDEVSVALLALGASYLVASAFSFDTPATTPVAFVAAGLLMASAAAPGRGAPPALRVRSANRAVARLDASPWPVRIGAAIVVVAAVTFALRPMRADLAAAQALRAEGDATSLGRASRHFDRAIALNPGASTYRAEAGELAERWAGVAPAVARRAPLRVAVARFQQAVDAEPGNVVFGLGLARTQSEYALTTADPADFAAATRTWRDVVDHDPYDWQLRDEHARSLNTWANALGSNRYRRAAIAELKRVIALNPDYAGARINLARLERALSSR